MPVLVERARRLAAYSKGPTTALGWEEQLGAIAPGQRADLVVLAPQVRLEDPPTLWEGQRIAHVIANGRVVSGKG